MERRATRRFRTKLPMRVRWAATTSGNGEVHTESEDISSRGVYFFLPTEIEEDAWVELALVLPQEITLAEPVRVRCQARVRRTEIKEMDRVGVAAEIEVFQVLRGDKNTGSKASNSGR
jgi:PilZ domain-containing protein